MVKAGLSLSVAAVGLAIFLAKFIFDTGAGAVTELRSHELTAARQVAELKAQDEINENRIANLDKKVDYIGVRVEKIISLLTKSP